jgi:hypothetical protein
MSDVSKSNVEWLSRERETLRRAIREALSYINEAKPLRILESALTGPTPEDREADTWKQRADEMLAKAAQLQSRLDALRTVNEALAKALEALADAEDRTGECDHKRVACEDIGCIGAEVRAARAALALHAQTK